jgi:hypothetical protein
MNGTSPLVSIIILNFNGSGYTERCLRSVLKTIYSPFEVILVDNASTDNSFKAVSEVFALNPRLVLLQSERNLGFAGGNNLGASIAKGKYLVFLNNDTEIRPDWLNDIVKVMESDPMVGAVQSKLLSYDTISFDGCGDFVTIFGDSFPRGRFEKDVGQYDNVEEVFAARGAAMTVRRDLFKTVGYFDEKFFLTCEDTDLCWRIRLSGAKILYVPKSVVYHAISSSSKKSFPKINHVFKNKLMMPVKNYSILNLMRCIPFVMICEGLSTLVSLVGPNKRNSGLSTIRAFIWLAINFRAVWQERLRVQNLIRKVPDKNLEALIIRKSFIPFIVRWFFSKRQLFRNDFFAFISSQFITLKAYPKRIQP